MLSLSCCHRIKAEMSILVIFQDYHSYYSVKYIDSSNGGAGYWRELSLSDPDVKAQDNLKAAHRLAVVGWLYWLCVAHDTRPAIPVRNNSITSHTFTESQVQRYGYLDSPCQTGHLIITRFSLQFHSFYISSTTSSKSYWDSRTSFLLRTSCVFIHPHTRIIP